MSLNRRNDRFLRLRWQTGLFLALALAVAAAGIGWIGISSGVYVPRTRLYFTADSGQDIRKGMAVKLSGFKIGTVEALALDESARVFVKLAIEDRYLKFIKKDSALRLAKENLIGDSLIDVSRGSEQKPQVKPGDTLRFVPGRDLEQIATEIRDRMMPVVADVENFLRYLNDPEGDIRRTLTDLRTLARDVNGTRERMDALLVSLDKTVAEVGGSRAKIDTVVVNADRQVVAEAGALIRSLRQASDDANRILAKLATDLPGIVDDLGRTTGKLHGMVDLAAPQIPGLVEDGREAVGGTRSMVDGLLANWPFNAMTRPPESGLTGFQSHD